MRIHIPMAMIVVLSTLCAQTSAWAQTNRSMFGGSLGGGAASATGTSTFGGGSGLGTPSTSGSSFSQMGSNIGGITGTESFIRGNQQRGAFVGSSAAEVQSQGFAGSVQAGQTPTGQQGSGLTSGGPNRSGGSNRATNTGRNRRTSTQLRTSLRVGFITRRAAAPDVVSAALVRRLSNSPRVQNLSPVQVVIQGRTATLRGVVATAYDRALAEQVTRLEAGIWQVKNELVVATIPAEAETPAVPDVPAGETIAPPTPPTVP